MYAAFVRLFTWSHCSFCRILASFICMVPSRSQRALDPHPLETEQLSSGLVAQGNPDLSFVASRRQTPAVLPGLKLAFFLFYFLYKTHLPGESRIKSYIRESVLSPCLTFLAVLTFAFKCLSQFLNQCLLLLGLLQVLGFLLGPELPREGVGGHSWPEPVGAQCLQMGQDLNT